MGSDIAKEGFMNFAALMVSAALMSIGSYAAYCYIEEPHIASNRLNAQAKADATVEIMQAKVRQGAELTYSGGVLTLDGTVVRVPPAAQSWTAIRALQATLSNAGTPASAMVIMTRTIWLAWESPD